MSAHRLLSAALLLSLQSPGCGSDEPKQPDAAGSPDAGSRADAQNDLATDPVVPAADATPPADLANAPDVANAADRVAVADAAEHTDIAAAADTVRPADLASPADNASLADVTAVRDLPSAKDTSATEATRSDVPASDAGCEGWTTLKRISPAEAADMIATSDPIVINVHIPYEGDIPGTDTSIPYTDVDAIEAYLKKDHCADILLVCKSGGMSKSAGDELIKRQYLRVRDLSGGFVAWAADGYPLLKDGGT